MSWHFDPQNIVPELENTKEIIRAFNEFSISLLAEDTAITRIRHAQDGSNCQIDQLHDRNLKREVGVQAEDPTSELFFINKFLVRDKLASIPGDANKLRISKTAFRDLIDCYNVPPAFVHSLCRHYLPAGRGMRMTHVDTNMSKLDYWYFLPVRVQVRCTDKRSGHTKSTSGSSQMNPFHYLHLTDAEVDIRGSSIAVFSRFDMETGSSTTISLNLMDGRWPKVVDEPQHRIVETIEHSKRTERHNSPCFPHLVYLTSVSRWWANALSSVNDQLICYEQNLQEKIDTNTDTTSLYSVVDRALHSIAAHLQRYRSELNALNEITSSTKNYVTLLHSSINHSEATLHQTLTGLDQISAQLASTNDFCVELEKKLANIVALLFNRMQIANTQAMSVVLRAIQADTQTSQRVSEEMKRDSLSMKTIAIVTMFFLPGATFAALLSMPFFEENEWVSQMSHFWLWVALTAPTTLLTFAFYFYNKRSGERKAAATTEAEEAELGTIKGGITAI